MSVWSRRRRTPQLPLPRHLPRPLTPQTVESTVATVVRRRWPRVVAIVAAAAVVAGAVVFGALTLRSGAQEGAATPEAAIAEFVESANRSDLLGMLEIMLPSERDDLLGLVEEMFIDARRLRVLPNTAEVRALEGLSLGLIPPDGAAELVAPDVAAQTLRGTLETTLTLSGREVFGRDPLGVDIRLTAVRSGARWFVSVWHTLAESLRVRSLRLLTWPAAEKALVAGASTPEDAVRALLTAVQTFSLRDLVAVLDPTDAGVLQRVAPWYIDGMQQALDRLVVSNGLRLQVSEPQFETSLVKAHRAVVRVSDLSVVVRSNIVTVAIRDNCGIFSNTGQADTRQCLGATKGTRDSVARELTRLGLSPSVVRGVLMYDDIRKLVDGAADQGIHVHDVDGKWFVSPTPTVVNLLATMLANGDAEGSATLVDDVEVLVRLLNGGTVPADDPTSGASGPVGQAGQPGAVDEFGRYTECLALKTFDLAKLCIEQGIADALFPRNIVDGSFLAPECGWRGSRFDPSITRLPNAEYVRLANSAAACMSERIASGLLIESQMPFELVRVECLQGFNPARMGFERAKEYLDCQLGRT